MKKPVSPFQILFACLVCLSGYTQDSSFRSYDVQVNGSSIQLKMIPINGGSFRIANYMSTAKGPAETKEIVLSDFWMAAHETTHDQFGLFFRDENLSQGSKTDAITRPTAQYIDLSWNMGKDGGFPVNSLSQDAALMFCRWLYQKTGVFYRLPTEAEWEYACRAGTNTLYHFGNDEKKLEEYAWYAKNSHKKYQKVGLKKPNPWGLYDMLGNVCEWTLDQYEADYFKKIGDKPVDPVIPPASRYPRSLRGGSYQDPANMLENGYRFESESAWNKRDPQVPKSRWWLTDAAFVGFRIVCPKKQPNAEEAEKFYTLYLGK